jgi:hypothetical protein
MAIPVSLEDARRQLRLDQDDESMDADIVGYIADAAAWVEKYTGHILIARDVTERIRVPGRAIELKAWPIKADATLAVADPALLPVMGVRLDAETRPATIRAAIDRCWPLRRPDEYLTVTVRAGYEADDTIPGNMHRAMLILISAYEADREGGDIFQKAEATARMLCRDYRLKRL